MVYSQMNQSGQNPKINSQEFASGYKSISDSFKQGKEKDKKTNRKEKLPLSLIYIELYGL